jgi:hypothetical protein
LSAATDTDARLRDETQTMDIGYRQLTLLVAGADRTEIPGPTRA